MTLKDIIGLLFIGLFTILALACGGGGGGGGGGSSIGFTEQMLNAEPTYFISSPGDPDGTTSDGVTQHLAAFSGSGGNYSLKVDESYLDATDAFVNTTSMFFNCVLNADKTLTCTNFLDPTNVIDFTMTANNSSHYVVAGIDQAADTWQDNWYVSKPATWLPAFRFDYQMLRHRIFENGYVDFHVWVRLLEDDLPASQSDVTDWNWTDNGLTPMPFNAYGTTNDTFVFADCTTPTCTWTNNYTEVGAYMRIAPPPTPVVLDDYIVTIDAGGGTVETTIRYDNHISLPYISSSSVTGTVESNGDITIDWTNPTGDPDWSDVNQIRFTFHDNSGAQIGSIEVSPTANSVRLPAALFTAMESHGNGTIERFRIQTRSYDSVNLTNGQIARGYSDYVLLDNLLNNNALLNGDYTYINLNANTGISQNAEVITGTANFDGAGTVVPDGGVGETYLVNPSNKVFVGSIEGQATTNGDFIVGTDTDDDGNLMMMIFAKQTSGATDALVSGTYISGLFAYDSNAGLSSTQNFGILATPGAPSQLAYTEISPGSSTPTYNYSVASDGTISITANDEFGQVIPSGQIFISADDDSVNSDNFSFASMALALPGSGMSNASLSGAYSMYQFMDDDIGNSGGYFITTEYVLDFDGGGSLSYTQLVSSVPCDPLVPGDCSGTTSYAVNADGTFSLEPSGENKPGVVLADGSVFVLIDTNTSNNAIDVMIGVKKP